MNTKPYRLLSIFTILICSTYFSCSKNASLENDSENSSKNKIKIGLGLNNKTPIDSANNNSLESIETHCPHKHKETIYALKIWQKKGFNREEYEVYAYGLFDEHNVHKIDFEGYSGMEYKIEATKIEKGTGEGLYKKFNTDLDYYYFDPFNTELLSSFVYQDEDNFNPDKFYPSSCKTLMNDCSDEKHKLFHHAEVERCYGEAHFKALEDMDISIKLHRVSFGLDFTTKGEEIRPDQRITVQVNMGKDQHKNSEDYYYSLSKNHDSHMKIIAHGAFTPSIIENFYSSMYDDKDFHENFNAVALLETLNESGEVIEVYKLAETEHLKVMKNKKTTYAIIVPKIMHDIKIGFELVNSTWMEEELDFPDENLD